MKRPSALSSKRMSRCAKRYILTGPSPEKCKALGYQYKSLHHHVALRLDGIQLGVNLGCGFNDFVVVYDDPRRRIFLVDTTPRYMKYIMDNELVYFGYTVSPEVS